MAVRGQHDLLVEIDQAVEGVEEFFLGAVLAADKLNIIDQQNIHRAVFLTEQGGGAVADSLDQIIGEVLGRHVQNAEAALLAGVGDGLQ